MSEARAALAATLERADPGGFRVTLLPDFFLDHFVALGDYGATEASLRRIHAQGGGNLPVREQMLVPGGNAANTALALARMGVQARLIARTSSFGRAFLETTLGREGVDLSRVGDDGDLAVTTALEYATGNVMLSTPGSVGSFGPESLKEADWTVIRDSDAVLVANWTLNARGTDLAVEVARVARKAGARTYVDTGDPSSRLADVPTLLARVLESREVDVVGINENELRHYSGAPPGDPDAALRAAKNLSAKVQGRLDLHTSGFAASFARGKPIGFARAFAVDAKRATGAGDSWNAGNVLGDLLGVPPEERMLLANAVAGAYVGSEEARHASLSRLAEFVRTTPLRP